MSFPTALRIVNGWLEILTGGYQIKSTFGTVTGSTAVDIVAAVPGKKIRVLNYRLQARAANTVPVILAFSDGGGLLSQFWDVNPREGVVCNGLPVGFEFETGVGQKLQVLLSDGTQAANVSVLYCEV